MNLYKKERFNEGSFLKILLVFFILFSFLYLYKLNYAGLIDVDEPRYAEAAREMLESKNYIVPYFNYKVRFDKPIFFYWLEALSMKAFGINEIAARLPSVFSAFSCLFIFFIFLSTFWGETFGLLGILILMSSFIFSSISRFSTPDMTLTFFITSSILSFFLGYHQIFSSNRHFKYQIKTFSFWYILAFIFVALGMLTKGPIAILIPMCVLIPFFWWIGKLEYFYKNISFWIGVILFFIISVPWYFLVHKTTSGAFTNMFFGFHNFSRYTSVVSGHQGKIYFFIPVVFLGFLPWTFFLIQSILFTINKGLNKLSDSFKLQIQWLSLWWFLFIFSFFSFSKTQLLTYILSAFPAISILITIWFWSILKKEEDLSGVVIGLTIFFIVALFLFLQSILNPDLLFPREMKGINADMHLMIFSFILLVGVSTAWASSNKSLELTLSILLSTFFILYFSLITILIPMLDKYALKPSRDFVLKLPKNSEIALYQSIKPSVTFYSRKKIKYINSAEKINAFLSGKKNFAVIIKKENIKDVNLENAFLIGEDSRNVFYTNFK